jgi:hypothetical protein
MSNVGVNLTSRPRRFIKHRPRLRFADEILKSSKHPTVTVDEQSSSEESVSSDYAAFSSSESSSSSRSQADTKDFTAIFKVADKVRVVAQILDVDSLHLLAEILIPCLENMLRSFKRLSSRIRSTPDFGVAFRGVIFSGRMFAHHIEKVTTRLSGIQLADAIQLSLQSLDMMVASLKALFGLIEHSFSEAKPLSNAPVVSAPSTTLARTLTHETLVENSPVPPMSYSEQAAVPSPLAMAITDGPGISMPPTRKTTTKGSLKRLVSGLARRSSLRPLTLWSGTVSSKSSPATTLAPRVGGSPKGLVYTRPMMPGSSHSEASGQQMDIGGAPPTTDQSTLVPRNLLQVLEKDLPSSTAELYFSSSGVLCAASLVALIRILASTEAIKDSAFDDFFFLSFRFFSNPIEIFNLLVAQYDEGPLGPLNSEHTILWEQDALVAKVRVAKVFLLWLRRHWRYQWDADILEPLRQFVSNRPAHDPASITWDKVMRKLNEASSADYCGSRIKQTAETGVTLDAPTNLPRPFGLLTEAISQGDFDKVDILHFHSSAGRKELARQLCLAASELFRHIDPEDAVRYWNNGQDKAVGERILQLASFENAQAYWTSHSIVIRPTVRSRAEVMEFFIDLASVSTS